MNADSIYFKGHTCFKNEWSGFDTIKPISIIIGRNNSGKSHLLDLVEALCSGQFYGQGRQYRWKGTLDETSLRQHFGEQTSGGELGGNHWQSHGRHFVGGRVTWETDEEGNVTDLTLSKPDPEVSSARLATLRQVVRNPANPLLKKTFRRLLADRDIATEPSSKTLLLAPDGRGASNVVRRYITTSNEQFSRDIIQRDLLNALNEIFGLDGQFTEIQTKEHDDNGTASTTDNHWEVYLGEAQKGLVRLSQSGSGLKTVLLVLLNLLVIPDVESKEKSSFVFAFEELENNLHPALLRRLFRYLENYAIQKQATIFLTTHSSTALDFFGTSEHAQIIRVSHDGKSAHATRISAHFDRLGVVSELGARPSDLLQANGIVWVEGPSDRVYLNRWIELYSDGGLREGLDYQCAFYGGALLARAQFTPPEAADAEACESVPGEPEHCCCMRQRPVIQAYRPEGQSAEDSRGGRENAGWTHLDNPRAGDRKLPARRRRGAGIGCVRSSQPWAVRDLLSAEANAHAIVYRSKSEETAHRQDGVGHVERSSHDQGIDGISI